MLAGTGNGRRYFNISPIIEIARIIRNCFKYFIIAPFRLLFFLNNLEIFNHYKLVLPIIIFVFNILSRKSKNELFSLWLFNAETDIKFPTHGRLSASNAIR